MIGYRDDEGSFIDGILENFNLIKIAMMIKAPLWFQALFPTPETKDSNPYFLINSFGFFVALGFIIGNSIFFKILEKACKAKEWKTMKTAFKNINSVFVFAAFVLFANSVSVMPYFYILEFETLVLNNLWCLISFGISLLFMILYLLFVSYIIYLVHHIPARGFRDFVKKWKYCEMLFAGFEENSVFTRLFFVIYILISIGSSTATSIFGEISVINGIIQLVLTFATFIYVFITKPLKNILSNYQLLFLQTLAIVKFGYIIWLSGTQSVHKADHIIKLMNKISTLILVFFLGLKLIKEMREIKRLFDQQPKRSRFVWINLIHVIVQQFGMGFEHSRTPKFYKEHVKGSDDQESDLSLQPTQYQESYQSMLNK